MLGFLIFLVPFLEIYVVYKVGTQVGLVNVLFALLTSFVLGLGIAKAQGRYILARMQSSLGQNQLPANDVLHGLAIFVVGILFAIPGFISDVAALFLLLPGTRHLIVASLRKKFANQVNRGGFKAFSFGQFGGGFTGGFSNGFPGGFPGSQPQPEEEGVWEREVTPKVIDIAPVSSKTTEKNKPTEN